MDATVLAPPEVFAAFLLGTLPFLYLALRLAARLLPRREAPRFRWRAGEAFATVAAPFVVVTVLQAVLPAPAEPALPDAPDGADAPASGTAVLVALVGSQVVLGVAAVLAVLFARRRPGGLAALGLTSGAPLGAYAAIPLVYVPLFFFGAALTGLWAHLSRALGWPVQQEVMRLILGLGGGELALAAAVAVVVGPFVEELVFRGFLLSFLVQLGGRVAGFLATALLFALMHGLAGLPTLLALSLFLCWLQVRTRSLWPSYVAHALNNAVSLGLALLVGAL